MTPDTLGDVDSGSSYRRMTTALARLRENVIHAATCGRTSSGMPICRPECEQIRADLAAVLEWVAGA